jgi:hypothetical protein
MRIRNHPPQEAEPLDGRRPDTQTRSSLHDFSRTGTCRHDRRAYAKLCIPKDDGGAERDRTADPLLAKQVLSQLSYSPSFFVLTLPRQRRFAADGPVNADRRAVALAKPSAPATDHRV